MIQIVAQLHVFFFSLSNMMALVMLNNGKLSSKIPERYIIRRVLSELGKICFMGKITI